MSCDHGHVPLFLFFIYNQQFITWHVKADCGSYFITTYKENILTRGEKLKEREERDRSKRRN